MYVGATEMEISGLVQEKEILIILRKRLLNTLNALQFKDKMQSNKHLNLYFLCF